ncbi:hypothetical protein BKE38_28630 [Pseudoroseomonas deserti]|uniref:Uncharacterized protein n=1 Tax=Teichococcus deserti TaxID=1817963 RepID=A0A1V2GUY7_9PROT|nr:hypothetical protein [Pseudoroseomonas deserti]ONG43851.1 hypothetical protein BKE38_28630 [Pseudoroseomonas deserti]
MTISDVALTSRSPADSPSYALRLALAERLASHRGARPRLMAPRAAAAPDAVPCEAIEPAPAPLASVAA